MRARRVLPAAALAAALSACGWVDLDNEMYKCSSNLDCRAGRQCVSGFCRASNCTKKTCGDLDIECGSASDGCGGTLACGSCRSGQSCESGVCRSGCIKKQCVDEAVSPTVRRCGTVSDGCGGTLTCGGCTAPETCVDGVCKAGEGTRCGGDFGECPPGQTCQNGFCATSPATCQFPPAGAGGCPTVAGSYHAGLVCSTSSGVSGESNFTQDGCQVGLTAPLGYSCSGQIVNGNGLDMTCTTGSRCCGALNASGTSRILCDNGCYAEFVKPVGADSNGISCDNGWVDSKGLAGQIGGSCTGTCAGALKCGLFAPGGYCLIENCTLGSFCATGGRCVQGTPFDFCAKTCTTVDGCDRPGYVCTPATGGSVCVPDCRRFAGCPPEAPCNCAMGVCLPAGSRAYGETCGGSFGECRRDLVCLYTRQGAGYCAARCDTTSGSCPSSPTGAQCMLALGASGEGGSFCAWQCDAGQVCPQGLECQDLAGSRFCGAPSASEP